MSICFATGSGASVVVSQITSSPPSITYTTLRPVMGWIPVVSPLPAAELVTDDVPVLYTLRQPLLTFPQPVEPMNSRPLAPSAMIEWNPFVMATPDLLTVIVLVVMMSSFPLPLLFPATY